MKVFIDRTNCVSCGTCWDTCPGLFEQNPDDSFSQIIEKFRAGGKLAEGKPPQDMEKCAADAVDLCPASVITVEPQCIVFISRGMLHYQKKWVNPPENSSKNEIFQSVF